MVSTRTRLLGTVLALVVAAAPTAPAAAADDTTPPVVGAVTWSPAVPTTYMAVAFTAAAQDSESGIASLTWSFGDGGTAAGASVSHTYTQAGTMTVSVTALDVAGNAATATAAVPVSAFQPEPSYVEPTLRGVRLRPRTVSARGLTPDVPRRARLSFRLSDLYDSTRVTFVVRGQGTRARRVLRDVREGDHVVRLGARVGGTRLSPGRYRVLVRANNRYGAERSAVRLRVVR